VGSGVADLVQEQCRLFEGGEAASSGWLVPVADVGEAALGPAAGRAGVLAREDRTRCRDRDLIGGAGAKQGLDLGEAFPVEAGGGRGSAGHPTTPKSWLQE
jgi:hypothetical protein